MAKILVVDDSEDLLEMLRTVLKIKGHEIITSYDFGNTVNCINSFSPDLILLDVWLGNTNGKQLCNEIKKSYQKLPVVLMSANPVLLKDYKEYKADAAIEKPFDINKLTETINALL